MIAKKRKVSERQYGITVQRHVAVTMSDGITIDANIFRPDSPGKFPALLGVQEPSVGPGQKSGNP